MLLPLPPGAAQIILAILRQILGIAFPGADLLFDLGTLINGVQPLFSATPALYSYGNDAVGFLWNIMRWTAITLLLLSFLLASLRLISARAVGALHLPAHVMLTRIVVSALAINLTLVFGHILIELNNALCALAPAGLLTLLGQELCQTPNLFQAGIFNIVLVLIKAVAFLLLIFSLVERVVILDVLLVLSPLVCLSGAFAMLWLRMFFVTCFSQFVVVLAISLGMAFQNTLAHPDQPVGQMNHIGKLMCQNTLAQQPAGQVSQVTISLLTIGILVLVARIPRLMSRLGMPETSGGITALGALVGSAIRLGVAFVP